MATLSTSNKERLDNQISAHRLAQQNNLGLLGGAIQGLGWGGQPQNYQQRDHQQAYSGTFPDKIGIKFFRINEEVNISGDNIENKNFTEPLDELRVKVAKWLKNKLY